MSDATSRTTSVMNMSSLSPPTQTVSYLLVFWAVFAIQYATRGPGILTFYVSFGFPLSGGSGLGPFLAHAPYRSLTALYAHTSLRHLIANTVMISVVGSLYEQSVTSRQYHAVFLVTGTVAFLAQLIVNIGIGDPVVTIVGPSGAICAMMGSVLSTTVLCRIPELRVRHLISLWVCLSVLCGVVSLNAQVAHAAGVFSGLAIGWLQESRC